MNDEWGNETEQEQNSFEQDEFTGSEDGDNSGTDQESYNSEYTYHYSYSGGDSSTKWEPNSEKYNSVSREPEKQPAKRKSLWWIPVAAVMTVVVAAVAIGAVFGFRLFRSGAAKNYFESHIAGSADNGFVEDFVEDIADEITDGITDKSDSESKLVINDAANVAKADTSDPGIYLTDVSDIVDEVMPAVVSITSRTLVNNGRYGGFFYYYYGSQDSGDTQEVESGIGSGTIVGQNEKELLILTSYHVVSGSSSLYVTFCDDTAIDGYIKASSESDDIAIVAVPLSDISDETAANIKMAALSDEEPSVGDGAIVIGNALGYGQSVVTGIVSALDRQISVDGKSITVIQTDAAINNGNSGGCLLNSDGAIIGISEAKITSSAVEGMCYAISVHYYYDKIMDMLGMDPIDGIEDGGSVNNSSQGAFLGIYGYTIGSQLASSYDLPEGVYVVNTISGGGAEAAGIQEGDVIIGIEGEDISSMEELQSIIKEYKAGDTVTITILRSDGDGYKEMDIKVKLTAAIG